MRTHSIAFAVLLAALPAQEPKRLTVHEWGTFTVLQNEQGEALPGVNINEESLPPFVHRLARDLAPDSHALAPLLSVGTHQRFASKGIPRSCPAARMRMETPILYFYPPKGVTNPFKLDVRVDFHRGWISEWYPNAKCDAPGFDAKGRPRNIDPSCNGSIVWNGLTIGSTKEPPKTDSKVWRAPRIPVPASVETEKGEAERYLFYRGIADLRAPLRVSRDADGVTLSVKANARDVTTKAPFRYPALWLADVRADGKVAFRNVPGFVAKHDSKLVHARMPGTFDAADYVPVRQSKMRQSMARALRTAGLYSDEAKAMLKTWEVSYFHSPGLRLFFVLPREWVDAVLPLTLSRKADTERVMIGRIELITPAQRKFVVQMSKIQKISSSSWFYKSIRKLPVKQQTPALSALRSGKTSLADLGITPPGDYAMYLKLGRFRDALILDENRRRPSTALTAFVRSYSLEYFHQPK